MNDFMSFIIGYLAAFCSVVVGIAMLDAVVLLVSYYSERQWTKLFIGSLGYLFLGTLCCVFIAVALGVWSTI